MHDALPALGELARLAKAATPGPWKFDGISLYALTDDGHLVAEWVANGRNDNETADGEFFAACSPAVILQLVALATGGAEMREALEQIAKGEGRYSRDPLTHAENTIADMTALALAALTPERPGDADAGGAPCSTTVAGARCVWRAGHPGACLVK